MGGGRELQNNDILAVTAHRENQCNLIKVKNLRKIHIELRITKNKVQQNAET